MSEQPSLSPTFIDSTSTKCSERHMTDKALSQKIRTQSLESHLQWFESGDKSLPWTRLMEWFVEAVIGAELFRNEHPSAPPLTFENIRIDSSSTIVIAFPSSPSQPSISGSLSSDISTLCWFFVHSHRTLEQLSQLIIPLHPKREKIVFSRIMIALVDHFVASGDIILPTSSPTDHSQYFAAYCRDFRENDNEFSDIFLLHNITKIFIRFIHHPDKRSSFILPSHSFLRGKNVESSEELLKAVKKVKETHSLEIVSNAYYDWLEWMTMMESIEKDATIGSDLSFLQSRCLRATLLSLQTKHQLIANPSQIEESSESDSSSNEMNISITRLPSEIDVTWNLMDVGPSQLSTAISTQTSLPSDQSSSDSQLIASDQLSFHSDSIAHHSRQILSAIHLHLTRPHPTSFPWDVRPSILSESAMDAHHQPTPHSVDENEKFDISLFDQSDDVKIVASLRRCHAIVHQTKSTECIVDVATFRNFLISGLHSSNLAVQARCFSLFFETGPFIQTDDDPREVRFNSLRKAFRDGTVFEQLTLLELWVRWCIITESGHGQKMDESDFDFDGLLAADLSDPKLFDYTCDLIESIFMRNVPALHHLLEMLYVDLSEQDTTHSDLVLLFNFYPPPRLLDTLLSSPQHIRASFQIRGLILFVFSHFGAFTAHFGACSSLAKVFTMLTPFDLDPGQDAQDWLSKAGEIVVSLHWLSIPSHFDSPLLSHLPSLAGAQRGVLQTLSAYSGIPSLVTANRTVSNWAIINSVLSPSMTYHDGIHVLSLTVQSLTSDDFHYFAITPSFVKFLAENFLSPFPAVVSAAFEFFHRLVTVSSDAVRIDLVKQNLLDHIVFAVWNSSFLDDYEKGIAVIGILLATIRRADQKRRMRVFDFFRGLNAHPRRSLSECLYQ
ncbi:hypothetical protein BLNAU_20073 [Blattamonas nauphoetae]|uniref:Uncharacterized protein n=1 Tax=Blattamonas nauphoetae TaxID=2049346 RepID=A0ABQ9X2Y8_9EUKA|nr:hypothetical protein BLNAU_20073 [Blattamonas nauphoetae]